MLYQSDLSHKFVMHFLKVYIIFTHNMTTKNSLQTMPYLLYTVTRSLSITQKYRNLLQKSRLIYFLGYFHFAVWRCWWDYTGLVNLAWRLTGTMTVHDNIIYFAWPTFCVFICPQILGTNVKYANVW